jgi:hypothetical protein
MWYDCSTGTCSQAGPVHDTGIWGTFASLPSDTYNIQIDMENGQTLTASRDYPGQFILPYVSSSTMQAQWNAGDLELTWTNPDPSVEPNWSEVDQLRIIVFDNLGNDVLFVRLAPTAESVMIPAALLSQAQGLLGGTSLAQWQVQTRAFDANSMNHARGYSNKVNLP